MVGNGDVLHVVIPGGHYTTVPRVCLDKYCEHIGIAAGSTAQDNFLRAVDYCEPQARQYKVSRGYRRPANVVVLQKVNRLLEPDADAGRRLEFVTGEASNNGKFPERFFSDVVQKLDDMKDITRSEFGRLINGSLAKQKGTDERARQIKGWMVLHLTDEEKIASMRAHGLYRPLPTALAGPGPEPAAEGPAPENVQRALEAEVIRAVLEHLVSDVELVDMRFRLGTALSERADLERWGLALQLELSGNNAEMERCAAEVQAARGMVAAKGDWFSAQVRVHQQVAQVRRESQAQISELTSKLGVAKTKLSKIEVIGIGERSIDKGIVLHDRLRTVAGAQSLQSELEAPMESDKQISDHRAMDLVTHVEKILFACSVGEVGRTRALLSALLERPAVRRLMDPLDLPMPERAIDASNLMVKTARETLALLKNGSGRRHGSDHLAFETILCALIPGDAKEQMMGRTIRELLGVQWAPVERAIASRKALLNAPCVAPVAGAFALAINWLLHPPASCGLTSVNAAERSPQPFGIRRPGWTQM